MQVVYDSDPAKTEVVDLAKYIDRKNQTVRSITGQIETDYGKGVYRVNSPTAQAVAGFLKDAGPQHLADVDVTCRNHYATIVRRAADGKPIRESGKLLLQVGTVCRPTGWTVVPTRARINGKQSDCFRIISGAKTVSSGKHGGHDHGRQWASHQGRIARCQWHGHAGAGRDEASRRQADGRPAPQHHVPRAAVATAPATNI